MLVPRLTAPNRANERLLHAVDPCLTSAPRCSRSSRSPFPLRHRPGPRSPRLALADVTRTADVGQLSGKCARRDGNAVAAQVQGPRSGGAVAADVETGLLAARPDGVRRYAGARRLLGHQARTQVVCQQGPRRVRHEQMSRGRPKLSGTIDQGLSGTIDQPAAWKAGHA